jgi:hypothetical protein
MKIEVNLQKKYLFFVIGALLILAGVVFGYAAAGSDGRWDSSSTVYHDANDVKVTIDGEDYSLQGAVDNSLIGGGGGSSGAGETKNCVLTTTNPEGNGQWTGYVVVNMTKNGRNICNDIAGCTIRIWYVPLLGNMAGANFYTSYPVAFRQADDDSWLFAYKNNRGINGDSKAVAVTSGWDYGILYDDTPFGVKKESFMNNIAETDSRNQLVFLDKRDDAYYDMAICDY